MVPEEMKRASMLLLSYLNIELEAQDVMGDEDVFASVGIIFMCL